MESAHNESSHHSGDNSILSISNLTLSSGCSSVTKDSVEKRIFTVIDPDISNDTEIEVITNIWANFFKDNSRSGTIKLFTILMNCFDVDVNEKAFTDFNYFSMYSKISTCFITLAKTGSLISPETINRSLDVKNTLQLLTLIFQHHGKLFFSNDTCKRYFIFLRDILIKISQCDFIGPRLLATSFGLKIVTGLLKSNNMEIVRNDISILLNEFLIKRWKDTACIIRETVLLEVEIWVKINCVHFLNDFWEYIYWALGDQSASVQIVALKISQSLISLIDNIPSVKLLIRKIITVLAKLLLSKNEEVVILTFNLYTALPSLDEDDDEEQWMSKIELIVLELIFSENSNVAKMAAKYFVDQMVNPNQNKSEQLKIILTLLRGVPSQIPTSITIPLFVDSVYLICPVLTDFELISQVLTVKNFIDDQDKYNLMNLLMYVIKWLITGIKSEHKSANVGDKNDIVPLHTNVFKKKEFTTFIFMHLLNQLKECKEPYHAFSLWVLLQFTDYKLLQDKMIIPEVIRYAFHFYQSWYCPTILEMVSKCIHIMTTNIEGYEQALCYEFIKNIVQVNINILNAGIENTSDNTPNILTQKNALIKMWSIAKYNSIPDDLEPLTCLSYYVPFLNNSRNNLIASPFALRSYMEILRNKLLKETTNLQNDEPRGQLSMDAMQNTFFNFLSSLFSIISKYDGQLSDICDTAFLIIDALLRIKHSIDKTNYELESNQSKMLAHYIFCVCKNHELNNELNTVKLVEVYLRLIQDNLIDINHLITLLQFLDKELFEQTLRPIFNFFCKKETGFQLGDVIIKYLVYMFENIISQKPDFKNCTIKTVINMASIISRLLCQCGDKTGKRVVSTHIHRYGIQYAMNDVLDNSDNDFPFKQYFRILASMCDTLVPYDAQKLADYFLNKPATHELINAENEYVLGYLYKLQEKYKIEENLSADTGGSGP